MPVSLTKVSKKINKKRGKSINSLNENSRDSQRLRRAGMRDGKLARVLAARMKANQPLRMVWLGETKVLEWHANRCM